MRYINATQVLPAELLEAVQTYADGIFLYIPRKAGSKRPWGTSTATRQELARRNKLIFKEYLGGVDADTLAQKFFLSPQNHWAHYCRAALCRAERGCYVH